jgi:hypothetical protein
MKIPNVKTAVKAACRVVRAKVRGESVLLDQASVDARLAACRKCPKYDAAAGQCLVCTCFVELKAQLATEKCPLHKWSVTNK